MRINLATAVIFTMIGAYLVMDHYHYVYLIVDGLWILANIWGAVKWAQKIKHQEPYDEPPIDEQYSKMMENKFNGDE